MAGYTIMKIKINMLIGTAIIPFMSGCISSPMALSPVGPDPMSRALSGPKGYLQVFSATEHESVASDYPYYFHPHSGKDAQFGGPPPIIRGRVIPHSAFTVCRII